MADSHIDKSYTKKENKMSEYRERKIHVEQFEGRNGGVLNQFLIDTPEGTYFQSYNSIIAFRSWLSNKITLDVNKWDYSNTTGKYRNIFLGECKKETERKIKDGTYLLEDLN